MTTVDIEWSASHEYGDMGGVADKQTTILSGAWADCEANAESAVNDIVEDFFRCDREWREEFGDDDDSDRILVCVYSPPSIAGEYRVDLERVIKARATKVVKESA